MRILHMQPTGTNVLGRLGENEYTKAVFDISTWPVGDYPGAGFTLLNLRHGDTEAYPVATVTVEGTTVAWMVTDTDLSAEGLGRCELIMLDGDVVAKSEIYITSVRPALDGSATPPEPWKSWQTVFVGLKDEAVSAAQNAQSDAQSASASASFASTDATTANQAASQAASSASSASTSASGASASASVAQTAKTAAESAQSGAESAQSAAETAASNASTSATNAAGSASQASQSATNAAGSATAAAQTLTQVQAEGAAQIAAIDTEGERVMESIPADYIQMETDVANLKSALSFDPSDLFAMGNISMTTSGWSYSESLTRVSTKEGLIIPLKVGDVVGLSNYSNAKYYLGWKRSDGTYGLRGWLTADFTVTEDGEYAVLITNQTETNQSSKDTLASLFFCPIRANDVINDNTDKINDIYLIPQTLTVGYIGSDGTINSQLPSSLEYYTQKIPCNYGQEFIFHILYSAVKSSWVAYALYDGQGVFISRETIVNVKDIVELYKRIVINNANAKYIAFTFRSYGASTTYIYSNIVSTMSESIDRLRSDIGALKGYVTNPNVKSISHKGYNAVAPENTLPAFKRARLNGFEYIETDIHFTSDGVPVCLHDDTIDRTSNGSGNIADMTYAQVSTYDFGSWKSSDYAGTKIPTFEQYLLLCRNIGAKPYIEMKSGNKTQIESLVDTVKRYGLSKKATWISSNFNFIKFVKDYMPTARIGYVVNPINTEAITVAQSMLTGENEVFIDAYFDNLTSEQVTMCINADLPLEVWTPYTVAQITSLNPYVSGITCDSLIAGYELYKWTL